MADDRPPYRPRRSAAGDEPTPGRTEPAGATHPDAPTGAPTNEPADAAPGSTPATSDPNSTSSTGSTGTGRFTDDEARPIFREDAPDADAATVRTPASTNADPAAPAPTSDGPTSDALPTGAGTQAGTDRTRRLNFTPRARPDDVESTTLLPRTAARGVGRDDARGTADPGPDDELDERPRRLGRRTRLALLASVLAAVIVVGIAIGYAVLNVRDQPSGATGPGPGVTAGPSGAATPSSTALLDDASMLSPQTAQPIGGRRTWTAGETVRGAVPAGSGPSCLGSDPLEGAPTAQQTITRTLTANGSGAPTALHVAQAYASPEDAAQAFAVTSRALGTCAVTGDWISNGRAVQGLGDEATAVATRSTSGGSTTRHWVVVSRTGRALDVVDAATPGKKALDVNDVAAGLASVVGTQCSAAGGTCPTTVATKDAPPPVGGDEPGFLATGDLPPAGSSTAPWVGTPVEPPSEDFTGSQCETVSWATTAATDKSSRVYLLQDVPGIFGLNEIVLTEKDATTASRLVDKIRDDWSSCKERKLTASVDKATKVTGVTGDGGQVVGYTTQVEQKAGSTTTRFRVGIASSGAKVAFVFLNPQKGLDVDGDDFNVVAVRAVQRATQQP